MTCEARGSRELTPDKYEPLHHAEVVEDVTRHMKLNQAASACCLSLISVGLGVLDSMLGPTFSPDA